MDRTLADPLVGTVLEGRYRIRGRIARGGMATVYDAVDERLERTVAVKIMHPGYASDPSFVHRFIQEARSAAKLSHPHVVAVYDQGVHEGLAFLVMEQIAGRTLREVLVSRGRLPANEALGVLEPVLDALAAAHRSGMVHRDVKPENVLIGSDGRTVKVADFGLARAVTQVGPTSTRGVVMGTVAYVSPEQITHGHADTRSDVYSAGIMLFEMLTGSVPYGGDSSVNIAFQHVHADVPPPSTRAPLVPAPLDELTLRATRRDPAGRPRDAEGFLDQLRAVRSSLGGNAPNHTSTMTPLAPMSPPMPPMPPQQHPISGPPTGTVSAAAAVRMPSGPPGQHTRVVPTGGMPPGGYPPRPAGHTRPPRKLPFADVGTPTQRRIALVAAVVVLALLAAGTGWYVGVGRYTKAPTLLDLSQSDATSEARLSGVKLVVKQDYDEKALRGRVFKQDPGPGGRVRKGGTVTVTISLGPNRVAVPTITGVDQATAINRLKAAGLDNSVQKVYSDQVDKGDVVSADPPDGSKVKRGTKILLQVSQGSGVALPDLTGKTREEAESTLSELGLQYRTTVDPNNADPSKAGTVLKQKPGAGTVGKDTVVEITVAQGQSQVQVPDVRGQTFEDAKQILKEAGLDVKRRGGGGGGDAEVFYQFPSAGTTVAAGTEVQVFTAG